MTKRFRAATSLVLFLTFVGLCWGNEQTISYPHNSIQLNSKFPVRIFFQSSENQKIPQISFASSREFQVFVDDETVSISDPEFSSSSGADQLQFFFPLTAFACALAFFGNKKHALFIAITILFVRANSQNANEIVITVTSPNGWVYTELFVESPDITGVDIGDAQVQQMDFNLCFTSGTKVELYQTTLASIRICADTVVLSDISFIDGASVEIEATDSIYLHTRDVFAGSFTIDSDDLEIIYDTRVCDVSVGSQVTSGTCEGGSTRVSLVGGSVDVDFGLLPPSRSSTPTISVSQSNTRTVSITPTTSHTPRPSRTPSETSSPSSSTSTSPTPSITSSASNSPSASASASNTPSASAIPSTSSSTSPSLSESATISASASVTPSPVLPGSPGNPIDVSEFVPVDNNYYSQSITETETYFTFTSAIDAIVLYSTCTLGDPDTDIVLYLDTPNEVTIDNGCGDNSVTARAYHAVRTGHIQLFKVVNPTNASVDFSFGGYDANIVGSSCADPVPLQPNGIEDYVYVTEVAAFETLYFSNTFIGPIDNDNRDFDTCRSSLGSTSVNVYDTDGIDLVCDTPSDSFTNGCINNSNLAGFVIDGTHSVYEVTNDSPVGGVLVAEQEVTPGGTCFSGTTLVTERTRGVIPMSEVSVGDFVLSGNQEWTEVIAWSHRHTSGIYEFVELSFGEDKSLLMTAEHLIFILEQNGNVKSIPAMKVQVGDVLLTSVGEQVIVRNISRKLEKGIYAPLTTSGDIEVDGVLASCFIHPMSHSWWQVVSYPFRMTPSWVLSMIWDPNIDQREMHGMSALVLAGATISHHITHLW